MIRFIRSVIRKTFSFAVETSGVKEPSGWLIDFLRGTDPEGGAMKPEEALKLPEVWYSVTKVAGHCAVLPMHQWEQSADDPRVKTKIKDHPTWRCVHTRPNKLMCAAVFWETLMVHALLRGNGRALIERNARGQCQRLHLLPTRTKTVIVDGEKWHSCEYTKLDGTRDMKVFADRDVLHVVGLSFDGVVGIDLMEFASDSFRTGRAALKATRHAFENYDMPGMVVTAPKGMFKTEDEAKEWLSTFREAHKGAKNRGKSAMIKDGMTLTPLVQNLKDFEASEIRKLTRQDAALWFLIEQIVGDDTSVSYNSLEQKNLAYLANCLLRWLTRIEQESDEKLFSETEKKTNRYFNKFNVSALLRADSKTQAETIARLITARVYNPNEGRELLDRNPYESGEEYANPAITPGQAATDNTQEGNNNGS